VAERWADLRRRADVVPPIVIDATIAVLCYLATVALPVKVAREGDWRMFVLAALASLPLLWRRAHPVLAAGFVGVGTVGLAVTGTLGDVQLPYGQLVATYTVAALAGPVWRLVVMATTGAGVVVSVLFLLGQGPALLGIAGLPFVVAYALGTGVRARRDRIGMLEERARRLAEAQEAIAARERERIAREIHDIVAHSVSLMVVQAEAGLVLAADPDKATQTFDTISGTGREALTQLDRALGVLRGDGPTRLPSPGLDELPDLIDRARLAGLDAKLIEEGVRRPVPADLAAAVYRLVQEAVTNTIKHAKAERFRLRLGWGVSALRVTVSDDGLGLVATSAGSGRGLIGMRERVRAFGGDLQSGPGEYGAGEGGVGFRVVATFPLAQQSTMDGDRVG
jgi:signal transduction histidine kinase